MPLSDNTNLEPEEDLTNEVNVWGVLCRFFLVTALMMVTLQVMVYLLLAQPVQGAGISMNGAHVSAECRPFDE